MIHNIFRHTFSNTNQHIGKLNIFPYTWESHVKLTGESLWKREKFDSVSEILNLVQLHN